MALRASTLVLPLLTALATAAAAQSQMVLDSNALGPIRACDALTTINRAFPQARDTVIASEGARWPAKIAHLDRATWILFETSWADTTHLSRFSTNSPRFHTRHGYAVGARIGDLIAKGERFTAELAEGQLGLTVVSENIGVGIDSRAGAAFPFDWPAGADATARLDPNARITLLIGGADCRR